MGPVTESLGTHDTTAVDAAVRDEHRSSRLYRALAWVGIAAGSLFIVATVFFSGFILGKQSDGGPHHGPHRMLVRPFPGPGHPMGPGGPMGTEDGPRAERLTPPSPPTGAPRP